MSKPGPQRDVVHGIDRDFTFGGEDTDGNEPLALLGFGHALELALPCFVAAVPFIAADLRDREGFGARHFFWGGFGFHGRELMEGSGVGAEVADECTGIADSDLDVGFEFDAGTAKGGLAFLKDAANGMEGAALHCLNVRDDGVEDKTVAVAAEPVEVAGAGVLVVRKAAALKIEFIFESRRLKAELFGETHIKEVEAIAKLDDRSDNRGALDAAAFAEGLLFRPFKGAVGTVFPKVDTVAEPVVGVFTGKEAGLSCEHSISQAGIAAVVGKDGALIREEVHFPRCSARAASCQAGFCTGNTGGGVR